MQPELKSHPIVEGLVEEPALAEAQIFVEPQPSRSLTTLARFAPVSVRL